MDYNKLSLIALPSHGNLKSKITHTLRKSTCPSLMKEKVNFNAIGFPDNSC